MQALLNTSVSTLVIASQTMLSHHWLSLIVSTKGQSLFRARHAGGKRLLHLFIIITLPVVSGMREKRLSVTKLYPESQRMSRTLKASVPSVKPWHRSPFNCPRPGYPTGARKIVMDTLIKIKSRVWYIYRQENNKGEVTWQKGMIRRSASC
jgi:hypothetical protein